MTETFRCGHPRSPENLKRVGQSARTGLPKYGCKICQRASTARSLAKFYLKGVRVSPAVEA